MHKYVISVIVPVYKVEKLLNKCVNSIINQTLKEIEIILVDDGSPDNCGTMCDDYASKDSRIVVIHKKNGGLSSARNAGIDIAKGEYLMFVDSDDYVEPNFCEKAYQIIKQNNVTCASFGFFEHKNKIIKPLGTINPRIINAEEGILSIISSNDVIFNMACNKIFHIRLFRTIRFPEGKLFEDQGTTYKLFDAAGKIYVDSAPLYHYVRREDSITAGNHTGNTSSSRDFNDIYDSWYERLQFIETKYPQIKGFAIKQIVEMIVKAYHVLSWEKDKHLIIKFEKFLTAYKEDVLLLNNNSKWLKAYYYNFWIYRILLWLDGLQKK